MGKPVELCVDNMPLPARVRYDPPLTDVQLLAFSESNKLVWIEREADGTLYMTARGDCGRALIIGEIVHALGDWAEADGRGKVCSRAGWVLPDGSMRGAPICWVCNEHLENLSAQESHGFPHVVPDFVIEVLSAFDDRAYMESKMKQWIKNGVGSAWLVDGSLEQVIIYAPLGDAMILDRPLTVRGTGPLSGLELQIEQIWAKP